MHFRSCACLAALAFSLGMNASSEGPAPAASPERLAEPAVVRFPQNPIIRPEMVPGQDGGEPAGANINFPSLIRTPDWLPNRLGAYYLYFSSHHGTYIRMAYADRLEGPWKVYEPGVLKMGDVLAVNGIVETPKKMHCASPDAHVDEATKRIRLYFHSQGAVEHSTSVAFSSDGLRFTPIKGALGRPYFRVFEWKGSHYAIDNAAVIRRSKDGLERFEKASDALARVANSPEAMYEEEVQSKRRDGVASKGRMGRGKRRAVQVRHSAVILDGDLLTIYFSRVGDAPESILKSQIRLTGSPETWTATPPILALKPEMDYEGALLAISPSEGGEAAGAEDKRAGKSGGVNQLRDPYVFRENGIRHLLYAVAGERGIAIAELKD